MSLYYNSSVRSGFLREEEESASRVDKVRPVCFCGDPSYVDFNAMVRYTDRDVPEGFHELLWPGN